ncbi:MULTISPECIES: N-acetylmuramoyl-L-alanine amidase [Bacillota]|jgi:N-acetylmuramoyl-L-alanine amidase|uniref:Amidase n=12 Tax=root TaxID=1 RepID=A1BTY1_9CAUD|nr:MULTISPECIES: N-acetylmuramoyl-L-alanine amidase [Bacillota]YP_009302047.1 endolysin [Staphylococcus phage CNPx]YP_010083045.1 endolysin [Staphylococcus phage IME1348_01]YP_950628.1 endolysin [Staphylococcus phage CNPH82]EID36490.1 N-acetylmuramoyl-L-alanine amidase [Staphylococcus epidermidis IS-250]MBA9941014.1 CHAP domain-containing protein [Ralstonia insidiosa]QLF86445.1 hypothetical protein Phi456_00014 [Staphylococcus phage 456]QQV93176.1 N-acetylmuramoyl-L-alanine amidase [Staphylo
MTNKTRSQAHAYLDRLKGYWWDFDGVYGAQCFDLANQYWYYVTGHTLSGMYAKDIPFVNDFNGYANVVKNYNSYIPKKGTLVVFPYEYGNGCGHVAIIESATQNYFYSLDQNWYGGARNNPPEVAQTIYHEYHPDMYFVEPLYSKETKVSKIKAKTTKPKPVKKVKKRKVMIVAGHGYNDPGAIGNGYNERDFIRKNIVDNVSKYLKDAGHTVGIYGKKQDMYQDTAYGVRVGNHRDYGLYWVKSQGYDTVIEFHLDSAGPKATGGHTIIPAGYPANITDKNIQAALKQSVGTIRGITQRNDLLNCNVANDIGIDYRLVELGFITSYKDMKYINENIKPFTKSIASAINGKPIGGTSAGKVKSVKKTWDWKGRFYPNTTIKVRKKPNGEIVEKGSWLYGKDDWVDIVQLYKDTKKKLWWGKFKYPTNPSSGYFYCALGEITDKQERIKKEKKLYGKIKWQ